MNNNRRRNFRPRPQKNSFRRRTGSISASNNAHNNGNMNFNRNGSMNNIHNVEKTMQKYQQLAKDAQSNGDPVLAQNYYQHADHFLRRYNELNDRRENSVDKIATEEKSLDKEKTKENETQLNTN
tara:strand:+ start:125 stop:499 length:375 start_codon:yes stop_codon:yes gene_type:complete